jgi:uncharacterized protein (TIGR02302 family)
MTRLSQPTEFQTGSTRRVERYVAVARAFVGWERVWPALWPATGIAGLFIAAALFRLFTPLPWTLHAFVLAVLITGTGLLAYLNLRVFAFPEWSDGARRLERDSGLAHRPISEASDALLSGAGDAFAEELWHAHLRRRLAGILRLRLSPPRSGLARKDPRALRYVVLLLIAAGILVAGRNSLERLLGAFSSEGSGTNAALDAWIDPPAYTGEAPIYMRPGDAFAVPAGSILNLRVHGAGHAPGLSMAGEHTAFAGSNGEYADTVRIDADSDIRVRASGQTIGSWSVHAIPDLPPHIAFDGAPGKTEHGALKLAFHASDDYGVVAVRAIIRPHNRPGPPLVVDLPLSSASSKSLKDTVYRDLTDHPYAGLRVDIVLEASDALGQKGDSRSMPFTLPARIFTNPLARAMIEQRQNLASGDTVMRDRAMLTLEALTIAPDHFYQDQPNIYMGLRAAYWALKNQPREDDIRHVELLLWQMALALEQNGLAVAAEELRRLQAMITEALAEGAPQEVIDALLQRYQQALQRYMQSLAENAPPSNQPLPPGAKVLSQNDLNALLNAIQQLAQSGNRAQAAQLLALLQSLLENLHMTTAGGGSGGSGAPQDKALSDAIQGLGDLMGKQRGLLDKTFRGEQGNNSNGGPLSQEQGQLRDQLGKVLQGLKDRKDLPQDLGNAQREMEESQHQLGDNDLLGSGEEQKQALDSLRKAAGALAQKLMQEQQAGQQGAQGNESNQDPLGRSEGSAGGDFGSGVKLPSQSEIERARSILQELRRRAAERGRPKEELDYIDRLLKEF